MFHITKAKLGGKVNDIQVKRCYEIVVKNYFCVHHKNKWKKPQYFKLLLSLRNLNFGTSNLLSTCRKINLLLINSIHLVFSSLETQIRRIQTEVWCNFVFFVWKETTQKSSKYSFSTVCVLLVQLASINVFYSIWLLELILGYKGLLLTWRNF